MSRIFLYSLELPKKESYQGINENEKKCLRNTCIKAGAVGHDELASIFCIYLVSEIVVEYNNAKQQIY